MKCVFNSLYACYSCCIIALSRDKTWVFSHPLKPHQKDKIERFFFYVAVVVEIETNFRCYKQLNDDMTLTQKRNAVY